MEEITHLTEEEVILAYYSEMESSHLQDCADCQARVQKLARTLGVFDSAPVPERSPDYGSWVWWRIKPKMKPARAMWDWRVVAAAAAVLVLMAASFQAGRWVRGEDRTQANRQVRNRVLLAALNQHLDRSCLVMTELANLPGGSEVDLTDDQERAEDLLTANRLYRQAVQTSGDQQTAQLLEDMERVLLEVVHSPPKLEAAEYEVIRQRIEDGGIVFKAKVVGQTIEEVLEQ